MSLVQSASSTTARHFSHWAVEEASLFRGGRSDGLKALAIAPLHGPPVMPLLFFYSSCFQVPFPQKWPHHRSGAKAASGEEL